MGELKMLSKILVKEFDSKVASYKPATQLLWLEMALFSKKALQNIE